MNELSVPELKQALQHLSEKAPKELRERIESRIGSLEGRPAFQDVTLILVEGPRKEVLTLSFMESGDWVYVKIGGSDFVVHKADNLSKLGLFETPAEKRYYSLKPEYVEAYRDGREHLHEDGKIFSRDLYDDFVNGRFQHFFIWCVTSDGFLYRHSPKLYGRTHVRKPILRKISLRYKESYWDLEGVKEGLEKNSQVSGIQVKVIPHYNQDFPGERELLAMYTPAEQEWDMMYQTRGNDWSPTSCGQSLQMTTGKLGFSELRKEDCCYS